MTGTLERRYPLLFCWIGGGLGVAAGWWIDVTEEVELALLQSLISISAILVGFLATALSIFLSISHYEVIKRLSAIGHDKRLMRFMLHVIYGLLAVVALSLLMIGLRMENRLGMAADFALGTAMGFSVLALHRLIAPIHNIIDQMHDGAG